MKHRFVHPLDSPAVKQAEAQLKDAQQAVREASAKLTVLCGGVEPAKRMQDTAIVDAALVWVRATEARAVAAANYDDVIDVATEQALNGRKVRISS